MALELFTESRECLGGHHCAWCRRRDALGQRFRQRLAAAFTLPDDAPDFNCPHGKEWGEETFEPMRPAVTAVSIARKWGPPAWARLHTERHADEKWVKSFTADVPCGQCKEHWTSFLAELPPVFGEGWLAWAVEAHNRVNDLLGRPRMTLAAATALWTPGGE